MVLPPKSTVCKNTNNIALNWPILAHDHIVWDMYQGAILLAHQTIGPSRFLGQITQLRGIEGKVKVGYKWKLQTPSITMFFPPYVSTFYKKARTWSLWDLVLSRHPYVAVGGTARNQREASAKGQAPAGWSVSDMVNICKYYNDL